jgi:rhodanese-related sulfurtransferase
MKIKNVDADKKDNTIGTDAALFVDARPENQYAQGHIHGALSLPWQDVDRYFVEIADPLEEQKRIVAPIPHRSSGTAV